MNSILRLLSPGDARTIIFGVLSILVLVTGVTQWTSPEIRLFRFLKGLPSSVVAVVVNPDHPVPASTLAQQFLNIPEDTLPVGVRPIATLLVESGSEERVAFLLDRSVAIQAGIPGFSIAGFTVAGDEVAVAVLRSGRGETSSPSPAVLRFLRQSSSADARVLLKPSAVARRLPPAILQAAPLDIFALTLQVTERRMVVRGLLPGNFVALDGGADVLLRRPLIDAALVLDGVLASQLLPTDLPPVLEALKVGSGAAAELQEVARALGSSPGIVAAWRSPAGTLEVVVGFDTKARPPEAVKKAARALLQRRLGLAGAVTERVRIGGQVIRHRRPRSTEASPSTPELAVSLVETLRDGWNVLRAPLGAGVTDLVVALNDTAVIFGTSEEAVFSITSGFGQGTHVVDLRFSADGQRLREIPAVALALRGMPEHLRLWIESLSTVRLELDADAGALRFEGSAEFSPQVPRLSMVRAFRVLEL